LLIFSAVEAKNWSVVAVCRWSMTPTEVNAFYEPKFNQIGIPAGILQRPVYDASFPMYVAVTFILGWM